MFVLWTGQTNNCIGLPYMLQQGETIRVHFIFYVGDDVTCSVLDKRLEKKKKKKKKEKKQRLVGIVIFYGI